MSAIASQRLEQPNIVCFLTEDVSSHYLVLFNDGKGGAEHRMLNVLPAMESCPGMRIAMRRSVLLPGQYCDVKYKNFGEEWRIRYLDTFVNSDDWSEQGKMIYNKK